MEADEFKKQFRITLFEKVIMITTSDNDSRGFKAEINKKHELKMPSLGWIETEANALNYYECCGVLLLFGIDPPKYDELYKLLQ